MRLRGRSLPRMKGWELICKAAKPETVPGFPFCSTDTDLNMCTKWENRIYTEVSRNALCCTDPFYPVSSGLDAAGSRTPLLFPAGRWESGLLAEN